MSKYHDLIKQLESAKCPDCRGMGEMDDAEPGDIYFNTWVCTSCNGTGLKFGVSLDIDYSKPEVIQPL